MFLRKKRFFFWRIFWVVLAVYVFLLLIAMIASITMSEGKSYDYRKVIELHHLSSQSINIATLTIFFYFTLNIYHLYFVERKKFFSFMRVFLIASFLCALFFIGQHQWIRIDPSEAKVANRVYNFLS